MSASTRAWSEAERILCVRLDGLGDVLMSTPAMRALRISGARPRTVTLLTSPAAAAAAPLIPELDNVLVYAAPWAKSSTPGPVDDDVELIDCLRQVRFDAAVIFTTYSQSPLPAAFACYLARIPLRLAYCHENPYHLLSDWVADPEPAERIRHEARRQLDLVCTVGASTTDERLSLRIPAAASAHVRSLLEAAGVDLARPWVAIHPGATAESRRYAPERFAAAADRLVDRTGCPVVLAGSRDEVNLVEDVRRAMHARSISLAGSLDLAGLAALIADASVLIANNSAPAHIAAALGTPVVDLYALTNPQHTPWHVPNRVLSHDVPCRNCLRSVCPLGHNACLQSIPPIAVADAACELLALTG
jgi:lipopolysaccharide heptosyltransferase II